jgi:hypothetical protein
MTIPMLGSVTDLHLCARTIRLDRFARRAKIGGAEVFVTF